MRNWIASYSFEDDKEGIVYINSFHTKEEMDKWIEEKENIKINKIVEKSSL